MHRIELDHDVLRSNDRAAAELRRRFRAHGVYVLNLMSGPGAGKTTLLERLLERRRWRAGVVEGDVQTRADADRIARLGVPVVQINTGEACHLDARRVAGAMGAFDLDELDVLFVENVGNLVCPAEFDLGEHDRAVLLSVAEGDDKPLKYPVMFHTSRLLVLSKVDLLPHVDFDPDLAERRARALNPDLEVLRVSARTGEGMDALVAWIDARVEAARRR